MVARSARDSQTSTVETARCKPLDKTSTPTVFSRLREEIHDVIWGGGGTTNNEVFTFIVKLILCKIFDEKELFQKVSFNSNDWVMRSSPRVPPHWRNG